MGDEDDDDKKKKNEKYPSIPANYVTILHLRERWIKQQQQKQKEKQNQEHQQTEEFQQQQQRELRAEEKHENESNQRDNRRVVDKAEAVGHESESTEKEINGEQSSLEKSKKKKKKKKKKEKKKKLERESEEKNQSQSTEREAHAPPKKDDNVTVMEAVRTVWEKKGVRSECRPKSHVDSKKINKNNVKTVVVTAAAAAATTTTDNEEENVEEKKESATVKVERKLRNLSMSSGVNARSMRRSGWGGYWGGGFGRFDGSWGRGGYRRGGFRRFGGSGGDGERPRNGPSTGLGPGLTWVKKGDVADRNQSSTGSLT